MEGLFLDVKPHNQPVLIIFVFAVVVEFAVCHIFALAFGVEESFYDDIYPQKKVGE
ncbi:MAG TPA: hypothetical protein VK658_06635 [Chryseolinea sp.]|nr:hypothetical protein [Chryseolinea sp.]